MRYGLTRVVFEERRFLELTAEQYTAASTAMKGVLEALSIEEKFNLVLENFEEFEGELLRGALSHSLFEIGDWSQQMTELHRVNRRLVNLLSIARLYIDQVPHNLGNLFGSHGGAAKDFEAFKSREYDQRLGYRALEAMRNYMQHRSLPIHGLVSERRRREIASTHVLEHTLTPQIEPAQLREDGKFKAGVLNELEKLAARVPLPPLVREYVAGLACVHRDLRGMLAPEIVRWDEQVKRLGRDFESFGASDLTGLAVVVQEENGTYSHVVHISPGPIQRRQWLERKNRYVEHYEQTLIANRPTA